LPTSGFAAVVCDTTGPSTNFENAANNLSANSWCEYTSSNYDNSLVSQPVGDILAFAARMNWDPVEKMIWYMGQTHGPKKMQLLRFSTVEDKWFRSEVPQFESGHAYDGVTVDWKRRHLWYKHFNTSKFYRMDLSSLAWDSGVKFEMGNNDIAYGAAFFPNFLGKDYMFNFHSLIGIEITSLDNFQDQTRPLYTAGSRSKSKDIYTGKNHIFVFYDPASEAIYFGGGTTGPDMDPRGVYRITKNDVLSRLDNLPGSFRVGAGGKSGHICSGGNKKLYIFAPQNMNGEVYELDPGAVKGDQLRILPNSPISETYLCTGITDYNVIAITTDARILLFKPPTSCANCPKSDLIPPEAPSQLRIEN
jgi:hypothetical protein